MLKTVIIIFIRYKFTYYFGDCNILDSLVFLILLKEVIINGSFMVCHRFCRDNKRDSGDRKSNLRIKKEGI